MLSDSPIPSDIAAAISRQLGDLCQSQHVNIPFAIESGSRAWGFPSPDSDYDCRFFFIRRQCDYLSLRPLRDVIELPLTDLYDINGWDLGKALKLLAKGNAVPLEWLMSPLVYREMPSFRSELLTLAGMIVPRNRVMRHYLHLAEFHLNRYFSDVSAVPLKKIFYVLRPGLSLRWMREHPHTSVPPMALADLLKGLDISVDLAGEIALLVEAKAVAREMGVGPVPPTILSFIKQEIALAMQVPSRLKSDENKDADALIDAFFLKALGDWAPI